MKPLSPKPKKRKINKRIVTAVVMLLFWIFVLPFASLGVSSAILYFGVHEAKATRFNSAHRLVNFASPVTIFTFKSAQTLSSLPLIGNTYSLVLDVSAVELSIIRIANEGYSLFESVRNMQSSKNLTDISPAFDKFTRDVQLLVSQVKADNRLYTLLPQTLKEDKLISFLSFVNAVIKDSDRYLGVNSEATYLVLFQNNMELRPTGGFIGSFALAKVSKAQFGGYKIYDIYDADGQLNGYIEPPTPIQRYLGEASWKMRDSNWDPDFGTSAKRALWFLDKTIGVKADGVVAVNLETLRSALSILGDVTVADYNVTLDTKNFYEKIQSEVHKDFFPGTRKKSNFLTAVAASVINKFQENPSLLGKALPLLFKNIESRDIEIYFDDNYLQKLGEGAGVVGSIPRNAIGFVEANLGVNKANQFVERKGSVTYLSKPGELTTKLTIKNNAKVANDETRYRLYLRSFAPKGFTPEGVTVVSGSLSRNVTPDIEYFDNRVEAGVFIEIKAGEAGEATFKWKSETNQNNNLIYWKQSGVMPYTLSLTLGLTKVGERQYNTTVDKDIDL